MNSHEFSDPIIETELMDFSNRLVTTIDPNLMRTNDYADIAQRTNYYFSTPPQKFDNDMDEQIRECAKTTAQKLNLSDEEMQRRTAVAMSKFDAIMDM